MDTRQNKLDAQRRAASNYGVTPDMGASQATIADMVLAQTRAVLTLSEKVEPILAMLRADVSIDKQFDLSQLARMAGGIELREGTDDVAIPVHMHNLHSDHGWSRQSEPRNNVGPPTGDVARIWVFSDEAAAKAFQTIVGPAHTITAEPTTTKADRSEYYVAVNLETYDTAGQQ